MNKLLIYGHRMYDLYAIFAKFLNICKQVASNLVNESGDILRRGFVFGYAYKRTYPRLR